MKNNIALIYWGHGWSMSDPNNFLKGILYKTIHNLSEAIIIYSANEKKYISQKNLLKTFVANNTINFNDIPKITNQNQS